MIDLSGKRFGRLIALRFSHRKSGKIFFEALCDCGKKCSVESYRLRTGETKSCGCLRVEKLLDAITAHGLSKTRVYGIWCGMKKRCLNNKSPSYAIYGGRGIKICDSWLEFENFYKDMGQPPSNKHSLDRVDNNRGYCPDNCRWSTRKEQANNTRKTTFLEIDGEKMSVSEASRRYGIKTATIHFRLSRGWDHKRAATEELLK